MRCATSIIIFVFCIAVDTEANNKYSAAANKAKNDIVAQIPSSLRELDKQFQIAKLNLLWTKAKHRLTDNKLQSLFSDLKIHDKEEIVLKHLKSDGKDPDGLGEARLRKKLIGIMSSYDLLEHFVDTDDPEVLKKHKALNDDRNYVAKDFSRDERLNKLWAKAEMTGFTHDELNCLKEEFAHHQDKSEEYMSLLTDVEKGYTEIQENSLHKKPESWNIPDKEETNELPGEKLDYLRKANLVREKHLKIQSGFDHLDRLTAKGPNHKEFVEPKVQGLWRTALEAKFSSKDLASLKEELLHYESRLLKIRHLQTEAALVAAGKGNPDDFDNATNQRNIKKHVRTVEKLHIELEAKIMKEHHEL